MAGRDGSLRGHIAQRLGHSAIVLAVMSFVIYGLMGLMPGDPIDLMITETADLSPEDAARLRALHGLDRPIHERYLAWLGRVADGDLGTSRLYGRPVLDVLVTPMINTLILLGSALIVSTAVAIPLGVLAAMRPRGWVDYTVNLGAFAGLSVPTFWLGLMMIVLFAVTWQLLPAGGVATIGGDGGLLDRLCHLVLPVLTLSVTSIGQQARYTRAAMLDVLRQDHVRTARAKGCGPCRTVVGHALRHAMIPVVTVLGLDVGVLFSGALITETVFAYPGMGKITFEAIMANDYNLALAALMLATAMTLIGNALADAAVAGLDPRVRMS